MFFTSSSKMNKSIQLLEWASLLGLVCASPKILDKPVRGNRPSSMRILTRGAALTLLTLGITKLSKRARDRISNLRWELLEEIEMLRRQVDPAYSQKIRDEVYRGDVIWNLGRLRNIRDDLLLRRATVSFN